MTLAEVADSIGVHEVTVSRWENGKRQPSEDKVNDLLDCYGVERSTLDNLARKYAGDEHDGSGLSDAAREDSRVVTSRDALSDWRDRIAADRSIDNDQRLLLLCIPIFLDRKSWVAPVTIDVVAEDTTLSRELVADHWEEMITSEYVERIGRNEWTLRLTLP